MVTNPASARPVALEPNPDAIPARLRALPHWGNWMFTPDERKRPVVTPVVTKRGIVGGYWASKSKAEDWGPYDAAVDAYNRYLTSRNPYHGIYLLFTHDDGLLGIDIDHCIRPDGSIMPWALWIIEQIGSYVELSVSETGIHIVVEAAVPWQNGQCYVTFRVAEADGAKVEIYSHTMGFAMTGVRPVLPDTVRVPTNVVANQSGVNKVYDWLTTYHRSGGPEQGHSSEVDAPAQQSPAMSDEEIMLRARIARNGTKFTALFDDGDLKAHGGDDSSADMALCCMLAFWTQDAAQIDRLFRGSRLMRPKWDEIHFSGGVTYGTGTIRNALKRTHEHYSPPPEPEDEPAGEVHAGDSAPNQDGAQGLRWTGPRDWAHRGPVTPEEARRMSREQLEHFVIVVSRWQYDLYHLLTNEARVHDVETGKNRPVLKPTDKVVTACAWFEANRAPGVDHPAGHALVCARRETIGRKAGVHADTVGKTLDHASAAGLVVKELRAVSRDSERHDDMYVGAPGRMPRNTEALTIEAAHRAKDRRRKKCPHCGASVFVHRTVCGGCGELLDEQVDGEDEAAVVAVQAQLARKREPAAEPTAPTTKPSGGCAAADAQSEDSSDIPYRHEESSEIEEYNHVSLSQDSSDGGPTRGLFTAEAGAAPAIGECSDCGQPIDKAWGRCSSCRRAEYARLGLEE